MRTRRQDSRTYLVNLYAVGSNRGGKFSCCYVAQIQSLTFDVAMTLGRALGEELAVA